jgi:hypothetical protein
MAFILIFMRTDDEVVRIHVKLRWKRLTSSYFIALLFWTQALDILWRL